MVRPSLCPIEGNKERFNLAQYRIHHNRAEHLPVCWMQTGHRRIHRQGRTSVPACHHNVRRGRLTYAWSLGEDAVLGGSLEVVGVQRSRCFSICRITCWSVIKLMIFTPLDSRYLTWGYNTSHVINISVKSWQRAVFTLKVNSNKD